jgi:FAD/FMN-containing dehydrogenase
MRTRRGFLDSLFQIGAWLAIAPQAFAREVAGNTRELVNDIHSKLNPTYVSRVVKAQGPAEVREALSMARREGRAVSIAGGRHAMGGQQFGTDALLLDTRPMNRVLAFDDTAGSIEVEAGIQWPELINYLVETQRGRNRQWGIIQKQTGADRLCLGGALGANVHGRGLTLKPIIGDIDSFQLMGADGEVTRCSRSENAELFRLVIGGYGLFGVVVSVSLRLMPRRKVQRVVEILQADELIPALDERIAQGYLYGDCQFSIDPMDEGFLKKCVVSCYRPIDDSVVIPGGQKSLNAEDWRKLYSLTHDNPSRTFDVYSSYYLSTNRQIYWSDTHQLSTYLDDYHAALDRDSKADWPGSEMITEVYVPRFSLAPFLARLAADFRHHEVTVIYGTIRLIEADNESFLAWAKESYACIVMNLHVPHSPQGISKAANDFRRIIDRAIEYGGSYFLTYHRWASREQVSACYPQMPNFLKLKRKYDTDEMFQSDWYRHYRRMF